MGLPNQLPINFPYHCQMQGHSSSCSNQNLELSSPLLCLSHPIFDLSANLPSVPLNHVQIPIWSSLCVWVTQSWPTLCDPMDCSPPGFSVHEIFQTKILEWVSISFSRGSSQPRDRTRVSSTGRWILYHWAPRKALYVGSTLRRHDFFRELGYNLGFWDAEDLFT